MRSQEHRPFSQVQLPPSLLAGYQDLTLSPAPCTRETRSVFLISVFYFSTVSKEKKSAYVLMSAEERNRFWVRRRFGVRVEKGEE